MSLYSICEYWEDAELRLFSNAVFTSLPLALAEVERRQSLLTRFRPGEAPTHTQIFELKASYPNLPPAEGGSSSQPAKFPNV
jgi:hypothetical protein